MSMMPAGRSIRSRARSHLRYREALGEDIGEIPEGLYPGDYLKPVGAQLAGRISATAMSARRKANGSMLFRAGRSRRCST